MTQKTVGIIGRGRMATHMIHYLMLESIPVVSWNRDDPQSPQDKLVSCGPVLVLINDDAIQQFVKAYPVLLDHQLIHFSGSKVLSGIAGLHPLMTFGPELYDIETYQAMPFIEEMDGLLFKEVFPSLSNPSFRIDKELKPLYHALCVMAGNFTIMLWTKVFDTFADTLGLPRSVLLPYLEQTCMNVGTQGSEALTGPLARGDWRTVAENIKTLDGDPFQAVYRSFAKAYGYKGG
ncbi:MAG: DUF2520 domain-containing protein [Spirochaetales bacterium]|jgi:2-dehydropantoate 2-reductase|nr:DUF2520 domain-containing protein [Spirochaetales bacterium]